MVNVLVVDDHIAVTEGTKAILETCNDIFVDTLSPPFSIDLIKDKDYAKYDVILMDINLGLDQNGIEVSKLILKDQPECKIIIYTGYDIEDYFLEAVKNGIYGAINKNTTKQSIVTYIHHVLNGEIVMSLELCKRSLKTSAKPPREKVGYTERERKILELLGEGLTNQEIADRIYVSKRTVEYSITEIFNKLNVSSRAEAVLIAKSEGLL